MSLTVNQLKEINFDLGGTEYNCWVQSWQIVNNTADGDKIFSFCPDGEAITETDPDYALEFTFWSDWTAGGISDFLMAHDGETADFTIDHHPNKVDQHVQWSGTVQIKAPNVGGEVKSTEQTQVTLQCIGKPEYTRV